MKNSLLKNDQNNLEKENERKKREIFEIRKQINKIKGRNYFIDENISNK